MVAKSGLLLYRHPEHISSSLGLSCVLNTRMHSHAVDVFVLEGGLVPSYDIQNVPYSFQGQTQ